MRQQRIAAVEYMRHRVSLMRTQPDLGVHASKAQPAAVVGAQPDGVEPLVVQRREPLPTLRLLPHPVGKRRLELLLPGLRQRGLPLVEHAGLAAVRPLHRIVHARVVQIQRLLNDAVGVHALRAVGLRGKHAEPVHVFALDAPLRGDLGVVNMDAPARVEGRLQRFQHELFHDLGRNPRRAQPHGDLRRRDGLRLRAFQRGHIVRKARIFLRRPPRLPQLLADIAGQVFVRRDVSPGMLRKREDHPPQRLRQLLRRLSGQFFHVMQVNTPLFGQRHRQRIARAVRMRRRPMGPNGAPGEQIGLARELAVFVQYFQRTQQRIGAVVRKRLTVCTPGQQPEFRAKAIVKPIQPVLQFRDARIRFTIQLRLNQLPHAIPQRQHVQHALLRAAAQLHRHHATVLAVVNAAVYRRIGVIADGRIGGNGTVWLHCV